MVEFKQRAWAHVAESRQEHPSQRLPPIQQKLLRIHSQLRIRTRYAMKKIGRLSHPPISRLRRASQVPPPRTTPLRNSVNMWAICPYCDIPCLFETSFLGGIRVYEDLHTSVRAPSEQHFFTRVSRGSWRQMCLWERRRTLSVFRVLRKPCWVF